MEYSKEKIEEFKRKADNWDALEEEIAQFYSEEDEDGDCCEEGDLGTIGEIAASHFGFL